MAAGCSTLRIFQSLKPVIGAINGPAVGIGMTMQLPMDIRLAADRARFGFVFARRGIVPEAARAGSCRGWSASRPRSTGAIRAGWSSARRRCRGLVRSVHAPDDLLPAARALAQR